MLSARQGVTSIPRTSRLKKHFIDTTPPTQLSTSCALCECLSWAGKPIFQLVPRPLPPMRQRATQVEYPYSLARPTLFDRLDHDESKIHSTSVRNPRNRSHIDIDNDCLSLRGTPRSTFARTLGEDDRSSLQEHSAPKGDSGGPTHPDDAIRLRLARCGMRILPRGRRL